MDAQAWWLIAAAVVLVVLLALWWFSPNKDCEKICSYTPAILYEVTKKCNRLYPKYARDPKEFINNASCRSNGILNHIYMCNEKCKKNP